MGVVHKQQAHADSPTTWQYPTAATVTYGNGQATDGIVKSVVIGPDEGAGDFVLRHFTLPADAHSVLEHHPHQHGVVVTHGSGRVLIGETWHEIGVGDVVYIAPDDMHQLQAHAAGLSFFCIIPAWAGV